MILAAISWALLKSARAVTPTYSPISGHFCLRKESRPFRPTASTSIFWAECERKNSIPRRTALALKAPARPRSPVTITSNARCSGRRANSRCAGLSMRPATERTICVIAVEKGLASMAISCARLSRAAETNFIARVTCCVLFTERMRRRKSRRVAMSEVDFRSAHFRSWRKAFFECFYGLHDQRLDLLIHNHLFVGNLCQDAGSIRVHELQELALEAADIANGNVIKEAFRPGVNQQDLFFDGERRILVLFQNFREPLPACKLRLSGLVQF